MKNTLETRLGLFVALIVIASIVIIEMLGGVEMLKKQKVYHAQFSSARELKIGDRVKMAGVEIGKVKDIKLTDGKVDVFLKVDESAPVKTDSIASIQFAGLMGQSFVAISFGQPTSRALDNHQPITTAEQADLNQLMQKLDSVASGVENLTKSFSGDTLANLVGPFTDFIKQNKDPLSDSIQNMKSISGQIASGQGTIGKLIYDETFYSSALVTVSNLQSATDEIKVTIADARKVVNEINAGNGTLGKLAKDDKLYNEATDSMTNLKEILQKINQGQGTFGKLVNDVDFYKNAKLTLQKVDKATEGLEDQGPLSVLGIIANGLF